MPCLLTLVALSAPRLVIALLWLFSSWFAGIFSTGLMILLGFIFLPTTLLWLLRRAALVRRPVDVLAGGRDRYRARDRRVTDLGAAKCGVDRIAARREPASSISRWSSATQSTGFTR